MPVDPLTGLGMQYPPAQTYPMGARQGQPLGVPPNPYARPVGPPMAQAMPPGL